MWLESMWVITPKQNFVGEAYRVADYAAYFRYVKSRWERVAEDGDADGTYPEPTVTCAVGFASVTHRGEETIICRESPGSGDNNVTN